MKFANVETHEYSENEVLFFIRIKGQKHFFEKIYGQAVIDKMFPHFTRFNTFSEYPNADHYIDLRKFSINDLTPGDFRIYNECVLNDLHSVIFRCRGLRDISFHEAKNLSLVCTKFFIDFFSSQKYKMVVIHIIDNYVLDIMYRIARHFNVHVLVLSEFFIYGYRRHTIYGEYNFMDTPKELEIRSAYDYFQRKEKSFWLKGVTTFSNIKYCMYLFFSYYARVFLRYIIGFKIFGNLSYEYRFAYLFAKVSVKNFFTRSYFDKMPDVMTTEMLHNSVYLPLHVYPEANVDYWINNPNQADYYTTIFEAVSFYREKNITVYIKEHPGFLYQRNADFYRTLKNYSNVRLIHPFDRSVNLIDLIPNMIVWLGSAGVEGLMQGKNVVVYDANYYSEGFVKHYRDFENAEPITEEKKISFLSNILSGVVNFNND
jgi:hypothetical protein